FGAAELFDDGSVGRGEFELLGEAADFFGAARGVLALGLSAAGFGIAQAGDSIKGDGMLEPGEECFEGDAVAVGAVAWGLAAGEVGEEEGDIDGVGKWGRIVGRIGAAVRARGVRVGGGCVAAGLALGAGN